MSFRAFNHASTLADPEGIGGEGWGLRNPTWKIINGYRFLNRNSDIDPNREEIEPIWSSCFSRHSVNYVDH